MITNPSRRQINRQRRKLTEQQRRQAAVLASTHLQKLTSCLPKRAKVGLYLDGFGELPTQPILDWCRRSGYQAYLPIVGTLSGTKQMRFIKVKHANLISLPTVTHHLGMKQHHQSKLYWAHELDLILCPLVAADELGNRMGMGGGYYDTTLTEVYAYTPNKPLRIGWCYEFQVVEQLHTQPWDVPLNALITPDKIRWF